MKANANWVGPQATFNMWLVGNGFLTSIWCGTTRCTPTMGVPVSTMSQSSYGTNQMVLDIPAAGTYTVHFGHSATSLSTATASVVYMDNVSITPII